MELELLSVNDIKLELGEEVTEGAALRVCGVGTVVTQWR
jgi:hypothetical protein